MAAKPLVAVTRGRVERRAIFDRQYFDRWYRDPKHRVFTFHERLRRASVAIATAEHVLGRTIRTVLDVGAGEGHWQVALKRIRPRIRYLGIDPSEYAVRRFGTARNIRRGDVRTLDPKELGTFDLVVAAGFLNLLAPRELSSALSRIAGAMHGVALLELFTADDSITGDISAYRFMSARWYQRRIADAGLTAVGLHLYATRDAAASLAELEQHR